MQRSGGGNVGLTQNRLMTTQNIFQLAAQALLFTGMIYLGRPVLAQDVVVTDSQVEANVLKALAGAKDLATQEISTKTVYGVVTLSGTVKTEASRVKAENLAANARGVKKVIDEIQISSQLDGKSSTERIPSSLDSTQAQAQAQTQTQPQKQSRADAPDPDMVLQSDGISRPASPPTPSEPAAGSAPASGAVMNDPDHDQAVYSLQESRPSTQQPITQQPSKQQATTPHADSQTPGAPTPYGQTPLTPPYNASNRASPSAPAYDGYPTSQQGYPAQNRYPSRPQSDGGNAQPWGGQTAGRPVVIPVGSLVRIRVNRFLASDKLNPGDVFEGFAANDVVAEGFVAIPRGAAVQGTVIDARPSGAVSGRGELSVHLSSVTLSGRVYPLASDIWAQSGPNKTGQTVSNAAGFGVAGALIGAIIGRGAGAVIGAGVGAVAGVGASAASGRGQVIVPAEGVLSFHLAQPAEVSTVSEQEMQRLAYGVPSGQPELRQPMYARPQSVYGYPPPPPYGYPAY